MKKRLLASVLTLAMLLSLMPAVALAVPDAVNGLTVNASERFPKEGESNDLTLSGGPVDESVTVRISGYQAPWYVTDGLVLHYDGIYNSGFGTHESDAAVWKDLSETGADVTVPTSFTNEEEGWTNNGLYLKDTVIGNQAFDEMQMQDGLTWEFAFDFNDEDYANWDMSQNPAYKFPVQLNSNNASFGSINNSTRVLFYSGVMDENGDTISGSHNWPPYLEPFNSGTFDSLTMSTGAWGESHRTVYRNGALSGYLGANKDGTPKGEPAANTAVEDWVYTFKGISFPVMGVTAAQAVDRTAYNLGRTVFAARLYNRELTADEIAHNAEVDQLRYDTESYNPMLGTFGGESLIEQFDENGSAYLDITVTFDDEGKATIPLVLNNSGENDLTFTVDGNSAALSLLVVTEEEAAEIAAANAAIVSIPDEITEDNLTEALEKVTAAQSLFDALEEPLRDAISPENQQKLRDALETVDAAAAGKLQITITYDANGGTVAHESTKVLYQYEGTPSFVLDVPSRANYTFDGWYLGETAITDADGQALAPWTSLSGATVVAKWTHNTAVDDAVLELDEAEDFYALARILEPASAPGSVTNLADYARFGFETYSADAYESLKHGSYRLTQDITLSNYDRNLHAGNGFYGISNFMGTFDGAGHTITLDIDLSKYETAPVVSGTVRIGVFASVQGATIKDLKLDGTVTGTYTAPSNTTYVDLGLLIGTTLTDSDKNTRLERITADVAVDAELSHGQKTIYFGTMIGRANSGLDDVNRIVLEHCENTGDYTVNMAGVSSNASRVGGLIGHAYPGVKFDSCVNSGDITTTGGNASVGDLCGTGGQDIYVNCVSAGSLKVETGTINVMNGMLDTTAKEAGNVIRTKIAGQQGDQIQSEGGSVTFAEDGVQTLDVPVYYTEKTRNFQKYVTDEYITVNTEQRLYLFDLANKTFTVELRTEDAASATLPFGTWESAIHLSTAEHFLWMQKAINEGDSDAIDALYALGGQQAPADYEAARIVLRSAYYVLDEDVALNFADGFTGIGDTDYFGGHFDGGNHTVKLNLTGTVTGAGENLYFGLFGRMGQLTDGMVEVCNLNVESAFDMELVSLGSYTTYLGGLAGNAAGLTIENVNVTLRQMEVDRADSDTGRLNVSAGGFFGYEGGIYDADVTAKIDCTMQFELGDTSGGTVNLGGFAGQGSDGGKVLFAGGEGIRAAGVSNAKIGAVMGYSWSAADFRNKAVQNSTDGVITLEGSDTAAVGLLIGNITCTAVTGEAVALQADASTVIEGAFHLKGRTVGGLAGYVNTNGTVQMDDVVLADNIVLEGADPSANGRVGGLIAYADQNATVQLNQCAVAAELAGNAPKNGMIAGELRNTTTLNAAGSAYVKRLETTVAVGSGNEPDKGLSALDVSGLTGDKAYGDTTALHETTLTALSAAPEAFAVLDADGTITFTQVGTQAVELLWNGRHFYTGEAITVSAKELTQAEVTITGINSVYVSDDAAEQSDLQVNYQGSVLEKNTDYTVTQNRETHCFTIMFQGNYSGSVEIVYTVAPDAPAVLVHGYSGVYDAAPHGVTVTAPDGAIMTYCDSADGEYTAEEIMLTDVGTSVVYWKASVGEQEVSGTATLSVTPAVVTVRVLDQRVRVGAEVPSLENPTENTDYTVTGLLGDDALTGLVLHYATTPNTDTAGATYAIQASGASAGSNYTIQYVEGTLTVTSGSASHSGASYTITVPEKVDHGTVTASHRNAKKGRTVTVTALPDSGYILRTLTVTDQDGKTIQLTDKGNGVYAFTMPSSRVTVEAAFAEADTDIGRPFRDVKSGSYYYDAVLWAVEEHVTSGTSDTAFSPDISCTRAQTVTFLWRAAGSPAPKSSYNPFTDVKADDYYYDAVLWAVEQEIAVGTSATTFSPNAAVTRGQAVTFLYRAAGAPTVERDHLFEDVAPEAYYADAVQWAVAEKITNGTGNTTFRPEADCTRGQIVTFLYRNDAK